MRFKIGAGLVSVLINLMTFQTGKYLSYTCCAITPILSSASYPYCGPFWPGAYYYLTGGLSYTGYSTYVKSLAAALFTLHLVNTVKRARMPIWIKKPVSKRKGVGSAVDTSPLQNPPTVSATTTSHLTCINTLVKTNFNTHGTSGAAFVANVNGNFTINTLHVYHGVGTLYMSYVSGIWLYWSID